MNKGEVFFGKNNIKGGHPIVYLRDYNEDSFIGAMLTTSSNYLDNTLMLEKHFKKKDPTGKKYKLSFNNTHLVNTELIKRNAWKPFEKIGELTAEGIKFVELKISDTNPSLWEDYLSTKNRFSRNYSTLKVK